MKVYVAGGFKHKAAVNKVQALVQECGHTITHDWTVFEHDDNDRTMQELRQYSRADIDAVRRADFIVAVFNDPLYTYRGTFAEIGAAIYGRKPVLILDTMGEGDCAIRQVPFFHDVKTYHFKTPEKLRASLRLLTQMNDPLFVGATSGSKNIGENTLVEREEPS